MMGENMYICRFLHKYNSDKSRVKTMHAVECVVAMSIHMYIRMCIYLQRTYIHT